MRTKLITKLAGAALACWSITQAAAATQNFKLSLEAHWSNPLSGDPLWISVSLSCPEAQKTTLQWLQDHEGDTNSPPNVAPALATNWPAGLNLILVRVETNGTRTVIMTPAQWQSTLQSPSGDLLSLEAELLCHARQFQVPTPIANLQPGQYSVEGFWAGTNFTSQTNLPANGAIQAEALELTVKDPTNVSEQASHADRLAQEEYREGHMQNALDEAQNAIRLEGQPTSPDRTQSYLLAACAQLALGQPKASIQTLQQLIAQLPANDQTGLKDAIQGSLQV